MLSKDNLNQLKSIKKDIRESKDLHRAIVRGTRWRYGFARLIDEQRDILIPHEEMLRVYPGDEVEINIISEERKKPFAKIEKHFKSSLKQFVGRVIYKKQHCFIQADVHGLQQNLFIPPPFRKKTKGGEYVVAQISNHPFKEGKAQAKIIEILSNQSQKPMAIAYIEQKYQLPKEQDFSDQLDNTRQLLQDALNNTQRKDLTALNFLTIDAASSEDLDDALYIEKADKNWKLMVAISDPCELIAKDSPIDTYAANMASTIYFPHHQRNMLPKYIACDLASLKPQQQRLALVCEILLDHTATVLSYELYEAKICSKAQTSYKEINSILEKDQTQDATEKHSIDTINTIRELANLNTKLDAVYKKRSIKLHNKQYTLNLDSEYQLDSVDKNSKTAAHSIVENCMITCNESVARWLVEQQCGSALFNTHSGFRETQLTLIQQLLLSRNSNHADKDLSSLNAFSALMQEAQQQQDTQQGTQSSLFLILSGLLERSKISLEHQPHFALGVEQYCNFTSPMRRYQDFLLHRSIKHHLTANNKTVLTATQLERLNELLLRNRQATQQLNNWLICQYLEKHKHQIHSASISQLHGKFINVTLDELGITANVDMRPLKTFKFNGSKMSYSKDQQSFILGQPLKVKLLKIDWPNFSPIFSLELGNNTLPETAE